MARGQPLIPARYVSSNSTIHEFDNCNRFRSCPLYDPSHGRAGVETSGVRIIYLVAELIERIADCIAALSFDPAQAIKGVIETVPERPSRDY